jgi:hypothetical protein
MPKECVVPESIRLVDAVTGEPGEGPGSVVDFRTTAYKLWLNDMRWQDPPVRRARLTLILKEFDKRPGQKMRFEDEDHAILVDIIKKPSRNPQGQLILYDVLVQRQLEPFEQCILNAKTFSLDGTPVKGEGEATKTEAVAPLNRHARRARAAKG